MLPDRVEELEYFRDESLSPNRQRRWVSRGCSRSRPPAGRRLANAVERTIDDHVYLIMDTRAVTGNSATFWRPNRQGYTCDLGQAGYYTKTEAEQQERIRPTGPVCRVSRVDRATARGAGDGDRRGSTL